MNVYRSKGWLWIDGKHEDLLKIRMEWRPRDLWIGAYLDFEKPEKNRHLYICILPCLPIHVMLPPKGWLYWDHPF